MCSGFESAITYLKANINQLEATELYCLGVSAGGFAAIRYGLTLNAKKIICFGAPSNLNADFLQQDGRARIIVNRLQTLPAEIRDLKPLVAKSQGTSEIHLYFGASMRQDKLHANHLKELPGVFLHELADSDRHDVLKKLEEDNALLSKRNNNHTLRYGCSV